MKSTIKLSDETKDRLKTESGKKTYEQIIVEKMSELSELRSALPNIGQNDRRLFLTVSELLLVIIGQNAEILENLKGE